MLKDQLNDREFNKFEEGPDGETRVRVRSLPDNSIITQVDVTHSVLPDGAATSDNQTNGDQKTQIVDTDGDILELGKEGENYSNSQHGILAMAVDNSSPTRKWRPFRTDDQGDMYVHPLDTSNTAIDPATSQRQDTTNTELGATNESAAGTDTATSGLNGLIKRINQHLTILEGYTDGVEGLITSTNTKLDTANTHLTNLEGFTDQLEGYTDGLETLITSTNSKLDTANTHLTNLETYTDQLEGFVDELEARTGATNETAPATDTATSGLNGRLQRIAQRLTTLIAFYNSDFGASSGAIRVAALPGNASGIADFNAGTTGAQTPRTSANITRNGTELNYDYGTVGANTLRIASQIGNATGPADFNDGVVTAQTLRTTDARDITYSANITGLVAANLATDIFTLAGSASKVIRVTRIEITATEGSNGVKDVVLLKRSSANSGGTSTNPTAVSHDSTDSAATATVTAYTANPTTGTLVGQVRSLKIGIGATNLAGANGIAVWEFGLSTRKPILLRGTGELLCVNLNGVTVSSNSFDIDIEWTERAT